MCHLYIPWRTVSHNQRVNPIIIPFFTIVNPLLNHEKSPFIVVKYPIPIGYRSPLITINHGLITIKSPFSYGFPVVINLGYKFPGPSPAPEMSTAPGRWEIPSATNHLGGRKSCLEDFRGEISNVLVKKCLASSK